MQRICLFIYPNLGPSSTSRLPCVKADGAACRRGQASAPTGQSIAGMRLSDNFLTFGFQVRHHQSAFPRVRRVRRDPPRPQFWMQCGAISVTPCGASRAAANACIVVCIGHQRCACNQFRALLAFISVAIQRNVFPPSTAETACLSRPQQAGTAIANSWLKAATA